MDREIVIRYDIYITNSATKQTKRAHGTDVVTQEGGDGVHSSVLPSYVNCKHRTHPLAKGGGSRLCTIN